MRKTAVGILLVGFAFVWLAIPFAGIDLLIDAVGFLLIFNAARVLKLTQPAFGPAPAVSLSLVALGAVQLFAGGWLLAAVWGLRAAGECLLCALLAAGFAALLKADGKPGPALAARVALWVLAAASLARGACHALAAVGTF